MDTYLSIVSKREVRSYEDRPIPGEVNRRILEAGRIAGSSANKQQRRFVAVESPEAVARLAEAVWVPTNISSAALVIVIAVWGKGPTAFDAGRAAQNMMLAAWNDGVGSCPNGMPDRAATGSVLGVAEGEEPAIVLSFGYPAKPRDPESRSAEEWLAAANRKPFDEVVSRI